MFCLGFQQRESPFWKRNGFNERKYLYAEIQAYNIISASWSDYKSQDLVEFKKHPGAHDLITRQK